jgi:NADH-quinone oxidoreductase subunit M
MMNFPLLSIVTFRPLVGGGFILLMIRGDEPEAARNARYTALFTSGITFVVSLLLWTNFDRGTADFQFVERVDWMPTYGVTYHMGVDGISVLFVLLSTLLTPICVLASWQAIQDRVKEYMVVFLVLETLMVGMFCALDFVVFYVFFEGVLIPMFLIIGVWGGPRRVYAAFKFFLYTLLGSVLMLLAILTIYIQAETTDIPTLLTFSFPADLQIWLWLAFFASFAVKVPMWPVHTWLPDAHVEAPTAGSVILAGVLLKMGAYGFIRFSLPMLPEASDFFTPLVFTLSIFAIVYTSLVALAQEDMKKLIAYSSVAHMGFVTLGFFTLTQQGIEGALYQMLSHGIVSAALFLIVGVVYDRIHSRLIERYDGLVERMPSYALVFRLHRRVPGPGRRLSGQHLCRPPGGQRHGPGRRLHALPLPPGDLREDDQGRPEVDPRHELAREGGLRAAPRARPLDGHLSHALPRYHVGVGDQSDRELPGGAGRLRRRIAGGDPAGPIGEASLCPRCP